MRLDIYQLEESSTNDLPDGYMSEVYQAKLWIEMGRLRELECRNVDHERMRRELIDEVEDRLQECLKAGCTAQKDRSCKLHK